MRIVEIGICIDNLDPKGIGRIRYRPYGDYQSEIENSVKYKAWDENDPFLALPFLPLHINIIPQKNQSIKIIRYDTDKTTQNVEYLCGPFTSPHDLSNQTFIQQHRDTTYGGVIVKDIKDIYKTNNKGNKTFIEGEFLNKKSNGSQIKIGDVGIKGNYGSDIIFSENGIQIRGGFLIDKQNGNKTENQDFPIMSKKIGRFTLKKFKNTAEYVEVPDKEISLPVSRVNFIIEYDVIYELSKPKLVNIFVYQVINSYGTLLDTNVFNSETDIDTLIQKESIRLINLDGTKITPTIVYKLDGTEGSAYINIRTFIKDFVADKIDLSLYDIKNTVSINSNIFPFYFRPSKEFKIKGNTVSNILNNIKYKDRIGHGLVYSRNSTDPKPQAKNVLIRKLKTVNNSEEQSFSSLIADKIYITSLSPNGTDKINKIKFTDLNPYDLTQEDYIKNIEPNTYSIVRGEILFDLLNALYNAFSSHIHQINKRPIVGNDPFREKLDKLMLSLEDELMNKSIRIN